MVAVAFPERQLQVTVVVNEPPPAGSAAGAQAQAVVYTWQQNRISIRMRQGGAQFNNARAEIYGVPLEDMNNVARIWLESLTPNNANTLTVKVWNGQTFTPLFIGVITWSAVDASGMPHVKLVVEANAAFQLGNTTAAPYSNAGPVTLQAALTTIVSAAGLTVNYAQAAPQYQLTDVRVTGSPLDQVIALMKHFPDLTWAVDQNQLLIRAATAPSSTAEAVLVSIDTGLQSSPVYSTSGLQLATLFNPNIRPGVTLNVQTQFDFINRTVWVASVLEHTLEANFPAGRWTTYLAASSYGAKGNNDGAST